MGSGDTKPRDVGTNHLCGHITGSHIHGEEKLIIQHNLQLSYLQPDCLYSGSVADSRAGTSPNGADIYSVSSTQLKEIRIRFGPLGEQQPRVDPLRWNVGHDDTVH